MTLEMMAAAISLVVAVGMFYAGRADADGSVKPFLAGEWRQASYAVVMVGVAFITVVFVVDVIAQLVV